MTYKKQSTAVAFLGALTASTACAEPLSLPEYLSSMDRTEVHFSGRIRYVSADDEFMFYNADRDSFGVTVDAGRDARESIENKCETLGFMFSYSELCTISGSGTVEIRGANIFISIETIEKLQN